MRLQNCSSVKLDPCLLTAISYRGTTIAYQDLKYMAMKDITAQILLIFRYYHDNLNSWNLTIKVVNICMIPSTPLRKSGTSFSTKESTNAIPVTTKAPPGSSATSLQARVARSNLHSLPASQLLPHGGTNNIHIFLQWIRTNTIQNRKVDYCRPND